MNGEESGTVIASALGFCEVDDPAMLGRFQLACTPDNPLWDARRGGIVWTENHLRPITFPGWVTDFAGASNEEEIIDKANNLRSLSDLDGAWWWWPIKVGETDVQRLLVGKCAYGKGMYLIHFFDKIIGLKWDAPTRNLTLRPFVAWEKFDYENLKFGSLDMDLSYENTTNGAAVTLKHNQPQFTSLEIILRAPKQTLECKLISAPKNCSLVKGSEYFGKPTWELMLKDIDDVSITVKVQWD